jgi:hypothetical protein
MPPLKAGAFDVHWQKTRLAMLVQGLDVAAHSLGEGGQRQLRPAGEGGHDLIWNRAGFLWRWVSHCCRP